MTEISCFNGYPMDIYFIKFEKYIIVRLHNHNRIILSYETFMKIQRLFNFYILSLFLTEDTRDLHILNGIKMRYCWNEKSICEKCEYIHINEQKLLHRCQPKRETSNKKIRKFIKIFNREFQHNDPIEYVSIFIKDEMKKTDKDLYKLQQMVYKDNTISLLTGIRKKYGNDIYDIIRNHLKYKYDTDFLLIRLYNGLLKLDNNLKNLNNSLQNLNDTMTNINNS